MADSHEKWMDEALALAAHGAGWVSPNPMVGAVVVKNGIAVGRGWHEKFGGPHAEVHALRQAGSDSRGATLYCTLEPCNHTGKTAPCTHAVIAAGIATVVLGARDPNPVASGGIAALRAAGIDVIEGVRELECQRINAAFLKFTRTHAPLVALKWAMSLDGRIATASGDSKWITGDAARVHAHRLRARHDAVMVGIGTILADDPTLNVRLGSAEETAAIRQPRRVVLDTHARTPARAKLFGAQPDGAVTIVTCAPSDALARERIGALRNSGADVIEVERDLNGSVSVESAILEMGKRGVLSVMVEGGARLLGAFVDSKHADRAHVFVAPKIIGGEKSVSAIAGRGAGRVADGLKFIDGSMTTRRIGEDVLIEGALSEWGWSRENQADETTHSGG